MKRHNVILLMSILPWLFPLAGCDKPGSGKSADKAGATTSSSDDALTSTEKVIIGRWELDRRASAAAGMANAKMHGGLGYEFKADGTGIRRLGISPADAITWKTSTTGGDSIKLAVTEDRPSGTPTAVEITLVNPNQIRITDVLGASVMQRTTEDISVPQAEYSPDIAAMSPKASIDTGPGAGIKIAVSHDGSTLISRIGMANERNFVAWDPATRKSLFVDNLAGGTVLPVAISADGKLCATGDANGAMLFNAQSGVLVRTFAPRPGQGGNPVGIQFSPDGNLLVMGAGRSVIGWDLHTGDEQFAIKVDPVSISCFVMFPDAKRIATSGTDAFVRIWNIVDPTIVKQLDAGERDRATALAVSEDGHRLASAHLLGKIAVFDLPAGILLRSIDPHHPKIESMAFLPDNKTLIHPVHQSTWDIALTDTETGELREVLKGHSDSIGSIALTSDGETLFSAGDDQAIRIWDLKSVSHP